MKDERDEPIGEYLWDRSGDPDPEIVRLEAVLSTLRQQGRPPQLPRRSRRLGRIVMPAMSAAAAVLLLVAAAWFVLAGRRGSWDVRSMAGLPVVDGATVSSEGRLHIGAWLVTNGASRARIKVGRIGEVDVDPNTRVQLVEARGREHRLALERGTIHARIWAPPKFFYVNTPSATAVDLGCAYTLQVDDSGGGLIRVTSGWVGFERDGRESYIPNGAVCVTRPGVGPGTPYYDDAPSGYGEALLVLDFGAIQDPRRAAALDLVLSRARKRDGLTLWHLLVRGSPDERARVFDRLATLTPPPRGVTREAVLRGERRALEQWWDTLGVDTDTWWRLWKMKW
jgi:FecR protein